MRRRDFGRAGFTGIAAGFAGCGNAGEKQTVNVEESQAPNPYGVQYYEKAKEVWNRQATSELPLIAEAADNAAHSLKNGGKLYSQAMFGHMLDLELRKGRPGNPDYLPTWGWNASDKDYAAIGDGDFLFFDYTKKRVKDVQDRGTFTVGVRIPYLPNQTTPKGVLATYQTTDNLLTEDCADIVLTSGIPFTNGVLYYPEIPAVRACPLSVQGVGNFYWMLSAEIAMRDKANALNGSSGKAMEYMELIKERGAKIRADFDNIDAVAQAMTGYIANGGRYWNYSFGCNMYSENDHRASGLPMSQSINPENMKERVKPGHFAIISGESSDIRENFIMAQRLKNIGAHVIYIGPAKTEGSQGSDITGLATWHIETYSPEREGALAVPGIDKKICPTTGILYALALWMLNSQFISRMIEADMTPGIDMGGHLIGGNGYNKEVRPIVAERGY
ncbi:MAG: hypothetical protein JXB48_03945 [Candidatus Latescibacteria bacterium]|nr:hypothetical protein [Candidatus Latescibacterota bacterium]